MVPINPREEEIEGQKCVKSLSELPEPQNVSVSVVTPPGETISRLHRYLFDLRSVWVDAAL